jgi:hypothetical protein
MRDDEPSPVWMSLLITHWDPWGTRSLYFNTRCACFPGVCVECLIGKQKKPILLVEMESLQFVGCSWFIGLIGLVSDSPRNKSTENRTCAQSCPSPVSSRPHLDAPGVHSLAGYVAIPPHALTDPDSREFSDSLLFKPTDTGTGPELEQHLPFTAHPHALSYGRPRQESVYLASHTHGHCRKSRTGLCEAGSSRLQ